MSTIAPRGVIVLDRRLRAQLEGLLLAAGSSCTVEALAVGVLRVFCADFVASASLLVDGLGEAGPALLQKTADLLLDEVYGAPAGDGFAISSDPVVDASGGRFDWLCGRRRLSQADAEAAVVASCNASTTATKSHLGDKSPLFGLSGAGDVGG